MKNKFLHVVLLFVMVFSFLQNPITPNKRIEFVKIFRITCLHKTPQPISECIQTIYPTKLIRVTTGNITSNNYIQVKYYINKNKFYYGWVAVYAVQLIYVYY